MSQSAPAAAGPPIRTPSSAPLRRSETYSPGEVWLKPNRSSRTKVPYRSSGSVRIAETANAASRNAVPPRIDAWSNPPASRLSPPPTVHASSSSVVASVFIRGRVSSGWDYWQKI